jgi:PAS domain S-box-containing protein
LSKSKGEYATEFYLDLSETAPVKVLHVDDEHGLLKVAKQCIEMEGNFEVDTAVSVDNAEKKLNEKNYDVIVSDYMMPKRTGLDFLKELRKNGNNIPFIVFTGKGREEVAVKALNLGADQYLNKVGDPETVYLELAHGIRKAVERKRTSNIIRESEEKFRNIFENAKDVMLYLDTRGTILDVNRKAVEVSGRSKEELVGKPFTELELLSPKEMPKLIKSLVSGREGKAPLLDVHVKDAKGQSVVLECQSSLAKTSGETTILVVARDVTKRKLAEEEVKRSEEKYKALVEETPVGICNLNIKGRIIYANKAFEEITGYPSKEFLGESAFALAKEAIQVDESRLKPITNQMKNRLLGRAKSHPISIPLTRKDGSVRWVEAESKLIRKFGLPIGLQASLRDVTERRKTEERLRESEDLFRSMVENSHGGIGIVDDDFKVKYVNEQAASILGYSKDELIGQEFRKFLPENDRDRILDRYLRRQKGEKIPNQYEFNMLRKDGKEIIVEMKAAITRDRHGNVQTVAEILDITEQKRTLETLRESEEKFRNLAEQLPNMVFINKGGRIAYANKKCEEVMGYTQKEFHSPNFNFIDLIAPESAGLVLSALQKHMRGEEVEPYEYRLVTRTGEPLDALITTKLTKFDGETAILGIITDITERKKVETRLRNSEERLKLLFQYAPDAYYVSDLKGTLIDGNKAAEKLTGYKKAELTGKSFLKLNLLSRRGLLRATKLLAKNALGKSTGPDEFTLTRKDGTKVSVEIRTFPMNLQGEILVLGIARDITERKKAEREVFESQQKFHQLFMGNPEAAVYVDQNFHVVEVNPRFTELFGYTPKEIVGTHINARIVPKTRGKEAESLDKNSKKGYVYHNSIRQKKNGELVPVAISAAPIIIEEKLTGHVALYKDISKLKEAEKVQKDTSEKLRVVGGLTRHDIRNKLSAIAGNIYLIRRKLAQGHETEEQLLDVESTIDQVEEILDFARNYEKLGVEELANINVEKCIKEALSLFEDLNGVHVQCKCPVTVVADSLLRQLFYNLVDNSLKHGEKVDKIEIYCKKTDDDGIRLVYEDNGVGIPSEEKNDIFKEGYGKGTGYGLHLIRKMCEVYGWTIRETGTTGQGARFEITIPPRR